MFSQLGPLFKATFRHAEESDTRQYIHHEDKKDGRRKKDDERADDSSTLWEDSTGVSVDALRVFLINFLNGTAAQTGMAAQAPGPNMPASATGLPAATPPETPPRPVSTMTARAVGAYQSMADKLEPHHPPAYPPVPTTGSEAGKTDADLLQGGEVRLIHQLIADLEELGARGVAELKIEPADSFLESLKNAVNLAKSGG